MEVNNGNKSDSMKKIEKQSNQKWWIYYNGKSTLKRFSFNKPSSGLWKMLMEQIKHPSLFKQHFSPS